MKDFTRENKDFWIKVIQELSEEIIVKKWLDDYTKQISLTKKKEDGHSYAQSFVDYLIGEVLSKSEVLKNYGFTVENSVKEREHGDFYLIKKVDDDDEIKVSCNGKLGMSDKLGLPNLCSIDRAVDYLDEKNLPYLVFKLRKVDGDFVFGVFDLYNYIDVVRYNDGPGQLMLSESNFYKKTEFKYLKTSEVIVYLSDMNEQAYKNLITSRDKRYNRLQKIKEKYERNEI